MMRRLVLCSVIALSTGLANQGLSQPAVLNAVPVVSAAPGVAPQTNGASTLPGKLPAPLWAAYKGRFITEKGRVVDTANNQISHSEGQGYGMLLAIAAGDRVTFDRLWNWTRANLMVRDDQLIAWRWDPNGRPAVADMNNASDGDILVAWALAEAAELWNDLAYRVAARRIAVEVGRKVVLNQSRFGALLLPAVSGFAAEDRADGPVVNLSYWVFPAFQRLGTVAPEVNWAGLMQSGLDLVRAARFGNVELPTDWISLRGPAPRPAQGFQQAFAYNSIRIPLYLAWAGVGENDHLQRFSAVWQREAPAVIETATARRIEPMSEPGYAAVAALTQCAASGTLIPAQIRNSTPGGNYYPATLHLLALVAAQSRYASCLRGP